MLTKAAAPRAGIVAKTLGKLGPAPDAAPALKEIFTLTDSMYFTMQKLESAIADARAMRTQMAGNQLALDQIFGVLEAPEAPDTSAKGAPPPPAPRPGPPLTRSRADEPGLNTLRGSLNTLGNTIMTVCLAGIVTPLISTGSVVNRRIASCAAPATLRPAIHDPSPGVASWLMSTHVQVLAGVRAFGDSGIRLN